MRHSCGPVQVRGCELAVKRFFHRQSHTIFFFQTLGLRDLFALTTVTALQAYHRFTLHMTTSGIDIIVHCYRGARVAIATEQRKPDHH